MEKKVHAPSFEEGAKSDIKFNGTKRNYWSGNKSVEVIYTHKREKKKMETID